MLLTRIVVRSAGGPYPVLVGANLIRRLPALLARERLAAPDRIVTVSRVWRLHGGRLHALAASRDPVRIADGEPAKSLATVARLYRSFAAAGLDRRSTILAFGGGVTGDIAGFAAASYLRGLPIVHVPTTLVSQVDSAIGGKTGVNLAEGKNLVGAFHPPAMVVCDIDVLATLPRREFRAGLFEVVKYGVIASPDLFRRLERDLDRILALQPDVLAPVVAACCRIKARVVGADERESGLRRILNFGHTIGHALETVTRYRWLRHGEAVAYGMRAAAHLSAARGLMPARDAARLRALIDRLGPLPPIAHLRRAGILEVMRRDKKTIGGQMHFVLAGPIGHTHIASDVTSRELAEALRAIGIAR